MTAFRFLQILTTIHKQKQEDSRSEFVQGAFIGWQIQEQLKGLFGGKEIKAMKFDDYLKQTGLVEADKKKTRKERQDMKKRAIATANKIIQLDKKRGEVKHG